MRINDWSSDVGSSDLFGVERRGIGGPPLLIHRLEPRRAVPEEGGTVAIVGRQIMDERDAVGGEGVAVGYPLHDAQRRGGRRDDGKARVDQPHLAHDPEHQPCRGGNDRELALQIKAGQRRPHPRIMMARRLERSEEHTSELQSLMRISYAVFCLKKQNYQSITTHYTS